MKHWRARRLLAALPDDGLPPAQGAEVRAHVESCPRCRRELEALDLAETLLRRMPHSVAPLAFDAAAHGRLVSLARWSEAPAPPDPERWRAPVLSLAGLVAMMLLGFTMRDWSPVMSGAAPVALALVPQDSVSVPVGWRPGQ